MDDQEKPKKRPVKKPKVDPQVEALMRMKRLRTEHWYALLVQNQHEKKIRDAINRQGKALLAGKVLNYQIQAWVATRMAKHKRTDRVVEIEEVNAPGIVFVRLRQIDKLSIYVDKHIKSFIFDRTRHEAAIIPDAVMEVFLDNYQKDFSLHISTVVPSVGKKVRILVGAMAGRVGYLQEEAGSHRFIINIAELSFSVEVKESDIVVVKDEEESERIDRYSGFSKQNSPRKESVNMMSMEQFENQPYKQENSKFHRLKKKQIKDAAAENPESELQNRD